MSTPNQDLFHGATSVMFQGLISSILLFDIEFVITKTCLSGHGSVPHIGQCKRGLIQVEGGGQNYTQHSPECV